MANLKDIRTRIASVKNTQKITRAMKLVATSKLRRAKAAIMAARPYAAKLHEIVSVLATAVDTEDHPMLRHEEVCKKSLIFVVTSDKGLCGPFNSGLLRKIEAFIKERAAELGDVELMVVGRKGISYFNVRPDYTVVEKYPEVLSKGISFKQARDFTDALVEKFTSGEYDRVYVAFNEFKSAISTNQRIDLVLPVEKAHFEGDEGVSEFIFEPNKEELLTILMPKYLETEVYRALLDSSASEHASRMTAMDNATNNANDMIGKLTLQYNRARQAAITRELVEITTGAQAIHG